SAPLNGLGSSARYPGFLDALGATLVELAAGLIEPDEVDGDLAALYTAYRSELDRLGLQDRELIRADAVARLASDLDAWRGRRGFGREGPDRGRVAAPRGAAGPRRGDRLAPVRARSQRLRSVAGDRQRRRAARGRPDPGAPTGVRGDRAPGPRAPRADALRR